MYIGSGFNYNTLTATKERRLDDFYKSYVPSIWEESEEQYASHHERTPSMIIKDFYGNPIGRWDETDF